MAGCSAFCVVLLTVLSISAASFVEARSLRLEDESEVVQSSHSRKLSSLVVGSPLLLPYHRGPILSGESGIAVYIVWYGSFSSSQRSIILDFFDSFSQQQDETLPTVSSWWKTTRAYRDSRGAPVMSDVRLAGQTTDDYTMGRSLRESDVQELVKKSVQALFPADSKSVYWVFTAEDVLVQSFCMNSCGSHSFTLPSLETEWQQLPYAWVGNAVSQCSGRCAWPYAKAIYGPRMEPLAAPNGDVGIDGMVINIATLLAGIATDPYGNAFYQGDASAPLEAATACAGIYGDGAYPGHPGTLLVDESTGASYNAVGSSGRKFLLPALWDPATLSCKTPFVPQIEAERFDLQSAQSQ